MRSSFLSWNLFQCPGIRNRRIVINESAKYLVNPKKLLSWCTDRGIGQDWTDANINFAESAPVDLLESIWPKYRSSFTPKVHFFIKAQGWQSQFAGGNCYSRDCKWVYYRMTIALASGNGYSWQCEWTQSHKNKNLRVKIATHGIANKLNRMMSMIAWLPS